MAQLPPDSELEPSGSKRGSSFHLATDSGRCPSPKGKVDVLCPRGRWTSKQSPNLAPGLTPPQPLHSRPEGVRFHKHAQPLNGSNTLPCSLQGQTPPLPGGHSMPVDDVLLWQLPVERWHQGRERRGAQQIHVTSEPLSRARTAQAAVSPQECRHSLWGLPPPVSKDNDIRQTVC